LAPRAVVGEVLADGANVEVDDDIEPDGVGLTPLQAVNAVAIATAPAIVATDFKTSNLRLPEQKKDSTSNLGEPEPRLPVR
jgi:hypothetical protein